MQAPSAIYSLTVRLEILNKPGMLGRVTSAIGKAGGDIGAIDLVVVGKTTITRDITFKARDEPHGQQVVDGIRTVQGVKVVNVSDRTFLMHLGGKIEVRGKMSVKTRDDLSMAYTPGVARVCMAFHHDQHGTAVVVLAALLNALQIVKKRLADVRIVFTGAGASGIATAKLLMQAGAKHVTACDRAGTLYDGRVDNMNPIKEWFAKHTNEKKIRGSVSDALKGADIFIGLSGPGVVALKDIKAMNRDPIVFAMANPIPEIQPEEAGPYVRVMATGRSDYPNQINNSCCFPGFFRGMLDVRARRVNDAMKLGAAHALAAIVSKEELSEEYITPSMFDSRVVPAVAAAVADAAIRTEVARRQRRAPVVASKASR